MNNYQSLIITPILQASVTLAHIHVCLYIWTCWKAAHLLDSMPYCSWIEGYTLLFVAIQLPFMLSCPLCVLYYPQSFIYLLQKENRYTVIKEMQRELCAKQRVNRIAKEVDLPNLYGLNYQTKINGA